MDETNRQSVRADLCRVGLIIPALNEQASLPHVLASLPSGLGQVIVVDNGSTDRTAAVAAEAGATVVHQPRRGYGSACLAGLAALAPAVTVVAFLDADLADDPAMLPDIVAPIFNDETDLVIGSRARGGAEPGSLTLPQRLGNQIATCLLGILHGQRTTDLGPFRAVRRSGLNRLAMDDKTYGWTVQMQLRAALQRLRYAEVAVPYRRRIGTSKISGTLRGVIGAGTKIPLTILRETLSHKHLPPTPPSDHLVVFARLPKHGRTKTRLIPGIGPEGAAAVHQAMTAHTLKQADGLASKRVTLHPTVRITGGTADEMAARFGPRRYVDQGEGDLGDRMQRAVCEAFAEGAQRVVLIGTDCPELTPGLLGEAFEVLRDKDVVIGPAHDGGYYLIGLSRPAPALFEGITWGTESVMEQTLAIATEQGLSVGQLRWGGDVDRPEDLPLWNRVAAGPTLGVVVPTLNEEATLSQTLAHLQAPADPRVKIVVADGGSVDKTAQIAKYHGVTFISGPPGRARQMNAGAAAVTSDVILFCHADTLLPPEYAQQIRRALEDPEVVGGAFALQIDAPGKLYRWIERAVRYRCERLKLPYGDQAIFVRRDVFNQLGGFDDALTVMEDYDLVRRLRRRGYLASLTAPVRTSARYWQRHGPLRATARNQLVIAAHALGIGPQTLTKLRHRIRAGAKK
ncbi:MAG: TIGR04283 family arsenosugar biosynthesis glycosyltransferase [Phycisphaeraceae bacterium]